MDRHTHRICSMSQLLQTEQQYTQETTHRGQQKRGGHAIEWYRTAWCLPRVVEQVRETAIIIKPLLILLEFVHHACDQLLVFEDGSVDLASELR